MEAVSAAAAAASSERLSSLLFDDDSLVADVIVDAGRLPRHATVCDRHAAPTRRSPAFQFHARRETNDRTSRPSSPAHVPGQSITSSATAAAALQTFGRRDRPTDRSAWRQHAGISDPRGRASRRANDNTITCFVTPADC